MTKAHQLIEEQARAFLQDPLKTSYFVASKRDRPPRRKWRFLEPTILRTDGTRE
jgi:hypothetical protein